MKENKFDGSIESGAVKVIVRENSKGLQYFAKPKNHDVITPHFYDYSGNFSVHQDSADDSHFRQMEVRYIASGMLTSGQNFIANRGLDLAVLPTRQTASGFRIDLNMSGTKVSVPSDSQHFLMAMGNWMDWRKK